MSKLRIAACFLILPAICIPLYSQSKKKELIVRVGSSNRQVNNHPWSYTTPGQASTNCSTSGTVNASGTTIGNTTNVNGTVNANTDCDTTYRPPQTTNGNIVTVDNASWVTDINSADQYLIQCTAHWKASKCSYLNEGQYKAAVEGNDMWITGSKGMKEVTAKYHILRYIAGTQSYTPEVAGVSRRAWTEDEKYVWNWYNTLSEDDKSYVREFCSTNPTGKAPLPHSKVLAGQAPDGYFYCSYWLSAKAKL